MPFGERLYGIVLGEVKSIAIYSLFEHSPHVKKRVNTRKIERQTTFFCSSNTGIYDALSIHSLKTLLLVFDMFL